MRSERVLAELRKSAESLESSVVAERSGMTWGDAVEALARLYADGLVDRVHRQGGPVLWRAVGRREDLTRDEIVQRMDAIAESLLTMADAAAPWQRVEDEETLRELAAGIMRAARRLECP